MPHTQFAFGVIAHAVYLPTWFYYECCVIFSAANLGNLDIEAAHLWDSVRCLFKPDAKLSMIVV